ncbi:MAG: hypothetical protein JEZ14_08595 [Marinilabiliaceae bacterium]|nr:hypothetical protein [Marinilabiliaceae bacterium]
MKDSRLYFTKNSGVESFTVIKTDGSFISSVLKPEAKDYISDLVNGVYLIVINLVGGRHYSLLISAVGGGSGRHNKRAAQP